MSESSSVMLLSAELCIVLPVWAWNYSMCTLPLFVRVCTYCYEMQSFVGKITGYYCICLFVRKWETLHEFACCCLWVPNFVELLFKQRKRLHKCRRSPPMGKAIQVCLLLVGMFTENWYGIAPLFFVYSSQPTLMKIHRFYFQVCTYIVYVWALTFYSVISWSTKSQDVPEMTVWWAGWKQKWDKIKLQP